MRDSFDNYFCDDELYTEEELCTIDKLYETNPILGGSTVKCDFPPLVTQEEEKILDQIYAQPEFSPLITPEDQERIDQAYESMHNNVWIQTYTGKKFYPMHIKPEDISIKDIAHALSLQCRFSGHCKQFYSVAEHSVLVASFCSESEKFHGLLHDASEAFIHDLAYPIKQMTQMAGYREIESIIQAAIYNKFRLDPIEPSGVKRADITVLSIEARSLMGVILPGWNNLDLPALPLNVVPLLPAEAERLFLSTFYLLQDKHFEGQ
jgi:hypothetical protein